jgi:hypothetical protein
MTQKRPQPDEYAPFYANYVALVPEGDILITLEAQLHDMKALLGPIGEQRAEFRYAPDKWSIKEVLGHISDSERIFAYRALRIARGDKTPLSGFEQDDYVREGSYARRKIAELLEEFAAVRRASITLFRPLDEEVWMRRGTANQKEISVLALAYITAGHERHHRRILEERYLPALPRA